MQRASNSRRNGTHMGKGRLWNPRFTSSAVFVQFNYLVRQRSRGYFNSLSCMKRPGIRPGIKVLSILWWWKWFAISARRRCVASNISQLYNIIPPILVTDTIDRENPDTLCRQYINYIPVSYTHPLPYYRRQIIGAKFRPRKIDNTDWL